MRAVRLKQAWSAPGGSVNGSVNDKPDYHDDTGCVFDSTSRVSLVTTLKQMRIDAAVPEENDTTAAWRGRPQLARCVEAHEKGGPND